MSYKVLQDLTEAIEKVASEILKNDENLDIYNQFREVSYKYDEFLDFFIKNIRY